MSKTSTDRVLDAFGSLKLSLACLALLMVLVVACTLAQVRLGTFGAVNAYIRSPLVYWDLPGSDWSIPIFPGGALVGLVLAVNLIVAQARRLQLSWRKAGLWAVHAGLILLFAGEFVTGFLQQEMQLPIEQGETRDFVESPRDVEVAVVDATAPDHDDAYGVPESLLLKGAPITIAGTPITLRVHGYLRNAELLRPGPEGPAPQATAGVGLDVAAQQKQPAATDDEPDNRAALIEPVADGTSYGTWLLSTGIAEPQRFVHKGRTYLLSMRFARQYLPYSVTLKKFSHDVYPGTDIPKNFSSLLHISNAQRGEERDVLVYMNQPLRYEGKAYYQASFGKGDTLSILQVVQNPGWLLPYLSCVLVGLGLCIHFALSLARSVRRRAGAAS